MKERKVKRIAYAKGRLTDKWYAVFADHNGVIRRLPLFTHEKKSQQAFDRIDDLVTCRRTGRPFPADLASWVDVCPAAIRVKLAKYGILGQADEHASRPLLEHLDGEFDPAGTLVTPGYIHHLQSTGNTQDHVDLTTIRIRKIIVGCGFSRWADISASKVQTFVASVETGQKKKRKLGTTSRNHYLRAMKSFLSWMHDDNRAGASPLRQVKLMQATADRRHERRALSVEELRWLLDCTGKALTRFGMAGQARELLYLVAAETGLRSKELRSLRRSSFDLEASPPTVKIEAAYAKNGRADTLTTSV